MTVLFLICCSWGFAAFIAFLPFSHYIENQFYETALVYDVPFFRSKVVSFDSVKTYILKMFTFNPLFHNYSSNVYESIAQASEWRDLKYVDPIKYFGYGIIILFIM